MLRKTTEGSPIFCFHWLRDVVVLRHFPKISQTINNIFNTFFSRENLTKIAIYPDLRAATFSVAMANSKKLTTKLAPVELFFWLYKGGKPHCFYFILFMGF